MQLDIGMVDVPVSGTRVRLSTSSGIGVNDRVLWAQFKGKPTNTGTVYVGISAVTTTHGFPLENNDDIGLIINFRHELNGAVKAGDFYFDAATSGDDVVFALVLEKK